MSEIFGKYDTQDLNRKSALDIFEKLRPIRQGINKEFIARRLVWELIQNAKDNVALCNSDSDESLRIEIDLTDNEFIFSHNKGYFRNENIRGLIRRYSSSDKDRNDSESLNPPKTTGRFGTGFMTTHLLSEVVVIKGVFQENETTYKPFEFKLDRSGHNVPELIQGVEKAFFDVGKSLSKATCISSNINDFTTRFIYHLNNEGIDLAKISVQELKKTAAYSLVNHRNIQTISLLNGDERLDYSLEEIESISHQGTIISIYRLKSGDNQMDQFYSSVGHEETRVVFPVKVSEGEISLIPIEKDIPRVFLDFPLIGTEDLHLPFVINSPFLEPTEPRDGISLTGGADADTTKNVAVFNEAFRLYNIFINYVQDKDSWKNIYNLANIRKPKEKDWINISWYDTMYIKPTRASLLGYSIVDTVKHNRRAIKGLENISFPFSNEKEIREKIWELSYFMVLPVLEHTGNWYEIIWEEEFELTVEKLVKWVESKKDLKSLASSLEKDEVQTIAWLNELHELVSKDEGLLSQINLDRIFILPNQNGTFQPKSKLYRDEGIDANLKSMMVLLGSDWKSFLIHLDIREIPGLKFSSKDQKSIVLEINRIVKEDKHVNIAKVCCQLTCLQPKNTDEIRTKVFNYAKKIFPVDIGEAVFISFDESSVWELSDKVITKLITTAISKSVKLEAFNINYSFSTNGESLNWINDFVSFLNSNGYDNLLNLKTAPIIPNQNGVFKYKDVLQIDNTEVYAEELKDISKLLGFDFREDLLAREIFPVLPEKQSVDIKIIADKISDLIEPILGRIERHEGDNELFRKLYLWFNKNKELAQQVFTKLYERKHRLINDDEIAANLEKAEILDEIFLRTGLTTEEFKTKFDAFINASTGVGISTHDGNSVAKDGSLYPVGAEEDIVMSPSLFDGSSEKSRISISEEAKDIILKKLSSEGFVLSDEVKINFTVINGIINPLGKSINLIVKSAKAGKIYFNPSEWLALTEPDSQLFVVTKGNVVRNITIADLESINDTFHMRFNTGSFVVTNLKVLANFFRYLPYTHFIFDSPESTADYLQQFGLSERNISASDLSADDKKLLH